MLTTILTIILIIPHIMQYTPNLDKNLGTLYIMSRLFYGLRGIASSLDQAPNLDTVRSHKGTYFMI